MAEKTKPIPMARKPKLIPKKSLSRDESVVFESRASWWSCMKSATLALLLAIALNITFEWKLIPSAPDLPFASTALIGISAGAIQTAFAAILLIALIGALWFFHLRWLRWKRTVYAATDERIILRTGILTKESWDIPLQMIENIHMTQSFWNRVLGYGRLEFWTEGHAGPKDMKWEAVPRPMTVRRILQEVMDIREKPNRERQMR